MNPLLFQRRFHFALVLLLSSALPALSETRTAYLPTSSELLQNYARAGTLARDYSSRDFTSQPNGEDGIGRAR